MNNSEDKTHLMDRVGNVYMMRRIENDRVYGDYMMPAVLQDFDTLGDLYNSLVDRYGVPIENWISEKNEDIIHLKFECGDYFVAMVL